MTNESITAYIGFTEEFQCRGYPFEVGKTYHHEGEVILCKSGFHACKRPLEVFQYYSPTYKFALVEAKGTIKEQFDSTKIACETLTIERELNLLELVEQEIYYEEKNKINCVEENQSICSILRNTGGMSFAMSTAFSSIAASTGAFSAALSTASRSIAINTGQKSVAITKAAHSIAATTGQYCATLSAHILSAAITTGDCSNAKTLGNYAIAANLGDYSNAISAKEKSVAVNTGSCSSAAVEGTSSIAAALGSESRAKAVEGSAIVLCYRSKEGELIHIRASKVGENGIKPNIWYCLDKKGTFKAIPSQGEKK